MLGWGFSCFVNQYPFIHFVPLSQILAFIQCSQKKSYLLRRPEVQRLLDVCWEPLPVFRQFRNRVDADTVWEPGLNAQWEMDVSCGLTSTAAVSESCDSSRLMFAS